MYMYHHHALLCTAALKIEKKLSQNKDMQLSKKGVIAIIIMFGFIVNSINCYHFLVYQVHQTMSYHLHLTLPLLMNLPLLKVIPRSSYIRDC